MAEPIITTCRVCGKEDKECRFLPLYIDGSEGMYICNACEMVVVELIRGMCRVAYRAKLVGYKRAGEFRERMEEKSKDE